jgi:hypothetical protein
LDEETRPHDEALVDSSPAEAPPVSEAPSANIASTPDMEAENPEEGAVPPGYDWPTHGGYLGCLLGMLPACLMAAFLGSTFVAVLNKAGIVSPVVAAILVVVLFVACIAGFGRMGWLLGRRFYRKYPRTGGAWGEDDVLSSLNIGGQQQGGAAEEQ